jgi:hypothetical protein
MDPLEPWIDAVAARRMAELLLKEGGAALPDGSAGHDAGYGPDFVGFDHGIKPMTEVPAVAAPAISVPAQGIQHFPPRSEAPPAQVEASLPEPIPAASVPDLAHVPEAQAGAERRGPLMARLGRFRDALAGRTSARGIFILDREGRLVMEDVPLGKLHFLARSLAQAYRPAMGQPGNVHVKIGANAVLEVIPVETAFGSLVLGAVVPQPLPASLVAEIESALKLAATPGA